jgi:hypothetical protein
MSSKSKWDQPASGDDKLNKDVKSASDAAAAAAAIAAKIAAQFASGAIKDEAAFQKNIDINDVRNRYMLTRGSTQQEVSALSSCPRELYRIPSVHVPPSFSVFLLTYNRLNVFI